MPRRSNDWHITGWPAILLAILVLPVAVPINSVLKIFGIGNNGKARTPAEVEGFIRDFLDDTGGEWDWDDFTSVSIRDPELDAIRRDAEMIALPVTSAGQEQLKKLLVRAEALKTVSLDRDPSGR